MQLKLCTLNIDDCSAYQNKTKTKQANNKQTIKQTTNKTKQQCNDNYLVLFTATYADNMVMTYP